METLDILSIDEMGQHGIDVGNPADWQGCILDHDLAASDSTGCWAIARHMGPGRQKWVVAPFCAVQRHGGSMLATGGANAVDGGEADDGVTTDDSDSDDEECNCDCLPRTVIVSRMKESDAELDFSKEDSASHHQADEHGSKFVGNHTFEIKFIGDTFSMPGQRIILSNDLKVLYSFYSIPHWNIQRKNVNIAKQILDGRGGGGASSFNNGRLSDRMPTIDSLPVTPELRRPSLGKSMSHDSIQTPRARSFGNQLVEPVFGNGASGGAYSGHSLPASPQHMPLRQPMPRDNPWEILSEEIPTSPLDDFDFSFASSSRSTRSHGTAAAEDKAGTASPKSAAVEWGRPASPKTTTTAVGQGVPRIRESSASNSADSSEGTADSSSAQQSVSPSQAAVQELAPESANGARTAQLPTASAAAVPSASVKREKGKKEAKIRQWFKRKLTSAEDGRSSFTPIF